MRSPSLALSSSVNSGSGIRGGRPFKSSSACFISGRVKGTGKGVVRGSSATAKRAARRPADPSRQQVNIRRAVERANIALILQRLVQRKSEPLPSGGWGEVHGGEMPQGGCRSVSGTTEPLWVVVDDFLARPTAEGAPNGQVDLVNHKDHGRIAQG